MVFSDEATFHVSKKVDDYNVRIWASEAPHVFIEHERVSSKLNVFAEQTVIGVAYLDIFEQWLFPQFEEDMDDFMFHQYGAPPHWHNVIQVFE